jgi:hypothetical protein
MAIAGEAGKMTTTTVSYSEELVWIESEDELELAGAVIRPVGRAPRPGAVIWVHGATSRFYGPAHVRIGRELAKIGYVFVTGNNRGHHLGANLLRRGGPQLGGDQLLGGSASWIRACRSSGSLRMTPYVAPRCSIRLSFFSSRRWLVMACDGSSLG